MMGEKGEEELSQQKYYVEKRGKIGGG